MHIDERTHTYTSGLEHTDDSAVNDYDLLCFSHLRWDFVFQRPQHLMSRFAKNRRVFFIEEHVFTEGEAFMDLSQREDGLTVAVPHIPANISRPEEVLRTLIKEFVETHCRSRIVKWYYSPLMFLATHHIEAEAIVYDCMDELSAFKNAPPELRTAEFQLFADADLVFTGGRSLFHAKKIYHPDVHLFPSSIDVDHFARALEGSGEPEDQAAIPTPRAGFAGVIDERFDRDLLAQLADLRPDWQFVIIGPVVKIREEDLPRRPNIHYLGARSYSDLPEYLGGWQVAMMPFAINEATRYISPTKTPEYLAAGLPVVSTPIHDVVDPYERVGLVFIAETAEEFAFAVDEAHGIDLMDHRQRAREYLSDNSWDDTFKGMSNRLNGLTALIPS
ncbi:glycosyltransferase family 1 protein [soil metagenome]